MVSTLTSRSSSPSNAFVLATDPMAADRARDAKRRCLISAGRKLYEGRWRELLIGVDKLSQHRYREVRDHANKIRPLLVKFNLFKLIAKGHADILHNEPPTVTVDDDSTVQGERWEDIADHCQFEKLAYEVARTANIESEAWVQIIRENGRTCLALRDGLTVFPVGPVGLDGQPRVIDRRWIVPLKAPGASRPRHFLRVERHSAPAGVGQVENFGYWIDSTTCLDIPKDAARIEDLRTLLGPVAPEPIAETGVSRPLMFRVCNGEIYGEPDPDLSIDDIDLIDQLAASVSQLVRTVAKHADPKMRVPDSVVDDKTNQVKAEDLEVVVDPDKRLEYISWDGKLDQMLDVLREVSNWLLITLEMSPSLMGIKPGAAPDSFDKLMLESTNTMKRANRVANTRRPLFERIVTTTLEFDAASDLIGYAVEPVSVTLHPGLPRTAGERNRELAEMHQSGQIDQQTMLERIHGPDMAAEIMERLTAESTAQRNDLFGGLVREPADPTNEPDIEEDEGVSA